MQSNDSSPCEAVFTPRGVLFHKKNKCPFAEGESKETTSTVIHLAQLQVGKYHLPRRFHDTCLRSQRGCGFHLEKSISRSPRNAALGRTSICNMANLIHANPKNPDKVFTGHSASAVDDPTRTRMDTYTPGHLSRAPGGTQLAAVGEAVQDVTLRGASGAGLVVLGRGNKNNQDMGEKKKRT